MMQYRLSTLLLAFVVVWASLAVFGAGMTLTPARQPTVGSLGTL
jgi:hypothetical protein